MRGISASYGYEITNPVDRFFILTSTVCCHAYHSSTSTIKESKITWLARGLLKGTFDFCGKPNEAQLALRRKECAWLLEFVSILERYPEEN